MLDYDWPGNVRELENCLERACAMNSGPVIHLIDLGTSLQSPRPAARSASGNGLATLADLEKNAIFAALQHTHGDKLQAADLLGIGKTTLYRKLKEYGPQY